MKNIIFIAPQAAGKGTQASLIMNKYGIPHISTGELLREAKKEKNDRANIIKECIDNGNLVPQSIINEILEERLDKDDCKNGFILDGYPRTLEQASDLDKYLSKKNILINYVINIDISRDEILKRISGRRLCSKCGENYNVNFESQRPKVDGTCSKCGSSLIQRTDDYEEAINRRLNTYYTQTEPLLDLYNTKGVLYKVDGSGAPEEVFKLIEAILND